MIKLNNIFRLKNVHSMLSWNKFPYIAYIDKIVSGEDIGKFAITIGDTIVGRYDTESKARKELSRIEKLGDCSRFVWNGRNGTLVKWLNGHAEVMLRLDGDKRARRCKVTEVDRVVTKNSNL